MSPRKCPAEIHPQIGPRPAGRTPSSAVLWGRGVQLAHGSRGAAAKSRRVARGARALTGWPSTPPGCHHARPAPRRAPSLPRGLSARSLTGTWRFRLLRTSRPGLGPRFRSGLCSFPLGLTVVFPPALPARGALHPSEGPGALPLLSTGLVTASGRVAVTL